MAERSRYVTQPLLWYSITGAEKRRWDILLSTPRISPELKSKKNPLIKVREKDCGRRGLYGITVYSEARIYLNALYSDDDIWRSAIHEMGHVAIEPWADQLAKAFGERAEEEFVQALEAGFSSFLPQLNFQLPALPFGLDQMRLQSQRKR